ncbi:crosslink repair DNA glycosylase YcaQ family protein [Nocardioides convexus]|uniref:DNA glycosylase AlkZ-like family protein n=1 Tax=Nocardioides convexus TaxID=2712224 RepID=UPI0024183F18|nr:crosslink repair DNA glycosylase YcaQ family protein [Nocardioides convexus]
MSSTQSLSRAQARRVALAAQGFLDPPHAVPTLRTFDRTLARTGVLQVDSVNVLQRAHLMPLYSRMGPYDVDLLRRASSGRQRRVVEYWAHVQAYMPVEPVAGDEAPHGPLPGPARQVVLRGGGRRAGGRAARGDRRAGCQHRA